MRATSALPGPSGGASEVVVDGGVRRRAVGLAGPTLDLGAMKVLELGEWKSNAVCRRLTL